MTAAAANPMPRPAPTTGVVLATLAAVVVGVWNVLSGIAAITEDETTEALGEVLFGIDITVWGWVWLGLGIVQLLVAYLIYGGSRLGRGAGLGWAVVNVALASFSIFVAPIYSLTIVAVNMAVIHALVIDSQRRP